MAEVSDYNSDSKKDYEEEAERIKRRDMLNYTSQRE